MSGSMTVLAAGTQVGPYKILAPEATSGVGQSYKASDTRADRVVALRLLPTWVAQTSEMLRRVERDTQAIAALEHPHIGVVHEIARHGGHSFLVSEALEGGTLAARLERGPLPWEEALRIAISIADALDRAHSGGVLHGSLSPANVVLTPGGPKLRDFAVASWESLAVGVAGPGAPQSEARSGLIIPGAGGDLETLRYLAPEQLEGLECDARTDIFAFGVVLHEMLTGKKTFDGKSRMLLISAITTAIPEPITSAQPAAPAAVDHIVQICLAKDPNDRWQTARDLLAELRWSAEAPGASGTPGIRTDAPAAQGKRPWLKHAPLALAGLLVAAVALPAGLYFRGAAPVEEFRFAVPASSGSGLTPTNVISRTGRDSALSPDGRAIAFATESMNREGVALYVLPLGSVTPRRLPATEEATLPFWSADGRFIGYVAGGKLKKVEASGGPPQEICDAADFSGGTWNREGIILFGTTKGLFRVSAEGGKPEAVTSPGTGEAGHFWPHFLPDGRHYLYTAWSTDAARCAVMEATLGSNERARVMAAESNAAYAEPGYLLFHREKALYAQPFDWKKPALRGEPARVADEIGYSAQHGHGHFSTAANGSMLYFQESNSPNVATARNVAGEDGDWRLAWADRKATVLATQGPDGPYRGFDVSPDGKRIAVHRDDDTGGDILVIEPDNSVKKLTFDASHHNSSPVWSPKGDRIAYSALQKGKWGIYQTLSSGSGTPELLYESELRKAPTSWSPDGKNIVFGVEDPKSRGDLWVLSVDDRKAQPLIATVHDETFGQISPDGKWIAYTSNLTGREEVHVQPFPSGSGHWQVSFHGGSWPRWRGDSKELFYHAIAGQMDVAANPRVFLGTMFSVPVTASGGEFVPGNSKEIVRNLANNFAHSGGVFQTYAVSPDGQRILSPQFAGPRESAARTAAATVPADPGGAFVVARNWTQGLKKK